MNNSIELKQGDIYCSDFISAKSSWFGRLASKIVKKLLQMTGEGKTQHVHAGIIASDGSFDQVNALEQTMPKLRELKFTEEYERINFTIYRLKGISDASRQNIVKAMQSRVGENYGFFKLLTFAIDSTISKAINWLMSRLPLLKKILRIAKPVEVKLFGWLDLTRKYVCSQVVAQAYEPYFKFAKSPLHVDPDTLSDICNTSMMWEVVDSHIL